MPSDLSSCYKLIAEQAECNASQEDKIASQGKQIAELNNEMEKLRKLISQLINGNRSEKRIFSDVNQSLLPFESRGRAGRCPGRGRSGSGGGHPRVHGEARDPQQEAS